MHGDAGFNSPTGPGIRPGVVYVCRLRRVAACWLLQDRIDVLEEFTGNLPADLREHIDPRVTPDDIPPGPAPQPIPPPPDPEVEFAQLERDARVVKDFLHFVHTLTTGDLPPGLRELPAENMKKISDIAVRVGFEAYGESWARYQHEYVKRVGQRLEARISAQVDRLELVRRYDLALKQAMDGGCRSGSRSRDYDSPSSTAPLPRTPAGVVYITDSVIVRYLVTTMALLRRHRGLSGPGTDAWEAGQLTADEYLAVSRRLAEFFAIEGLGWEERLFAPEESKAIKDRRADILEVDDR
jgi:hypothetical protein